MNKHRLFTLITIPILALLTTTLAFSEPITAEENALFNTDSTIATANSQDIPLFTDQKSINFSGRLDNLQALIVNKDSSLTGITTTDLFLDIRLPKKTKAFIDLGLTNLSATSNIYVDIKELFFDFSIDQKYTIRSGKQFMKWGRGTLWNPVDFVNRTPVNFLDLNATRTGVSGIRLTIPGDHQDNTYLFLDMTNASTPKQLALLGKYEWLIGSTELGISTWLSPQQAVKTGLDCSTKWENWDIEGELAISSTQTLSPLIGLTHQWNWERPNRITFHYEVYEKTATTNTVYHAALLTITEFPIYPLTYSFNLIQNLTDTSGLLSTGLAYTVVDGLQINGNLLVYLGPEHGEYTPNGNGLGLLLQGILTF